MPRSTAEEMADLREETFAQDGRCRWPGCQWDDTEAGLPLQMAHLTHRGMGGSKERNDLSNVVMLCRIHHDCLDGRTGLGILRTELNTLFRALLGSSRSTPT